MQVAVTGLFHRRPTWPSLVLSQPCSRVSPQHPPHSHDPLSDALLPSIGLLVERMQRKCGDAAAPLAPRTPSRCSSLPAPSRHQLQHWKGYRPVRPCKGSSAWLDKSIALDIILSGALPAIHALLRTHILMSPDFPTASAL